MSQFVTENRLDAALRQVYSHWPTYLLGYGGGALFALIIVLVSVQQEWWGFIPLMLAFLLVLIYLFSASLWMAYRQNEQDDTLLLYTWAQISPTDSLAHIDLGRRHIPLRLLRFLTTGKLSVIDVYNPQLTPGAALVRARNQATHTVQTDPRLIWLEGSVDLLPLPDKSMPVVTMAYTLPEFWQSGDREQLLAEIYRVLKPGGRLILLERVRQPQNVMLLGPLVWNWPAAAYWSALLTQAGFTIRKQESLHAGLVHAFRADKPVQYQSRQLDLGF
jgi:SAM-dependent methyltransferase